MNEYMPYIYGILVIGGISSMLNYFLQRKWKKESDDKSSLDSEEVLWYRSTIEELQEKIYELKKG